MPGQSMNLRENLLEFHDYVALPNSLWKCIYSWYGADYALERYLVKDQDTGITFLDLYREADEA